MSVGSFLLTKMPGIVLVYVNIKFTGTVSWDDSEGEREEVGDRGSSVHSEELLGEEVEDTDNKLEGEYFILKTCRTALLHCIIPC